MNQLFMEAIADRPDRYVAEENFDDAATTSLMTHRFECGVGQFHGEGKLRSLWTKADA